MTFLLSSYEPPFCFPNGLFTITLGLDYLLIAANISNLFYFSKNYSFHQIPFITILVGAMITMLSCMVCLISFIWNGPNQ